MDNRYDHKICDAQMRELWQKNQTYRHINPAFKAFTIDTPPPTVSGLLHIGHIFSYTQTDIIARYKRMTGHNVFYPFGFDCNGLATERFVEKKHNTNVSKLGREKFIELCLSTTDEIKIKFVDLWRNMGLSAELEHTYSTISKDVQKIAQESFLELARKDFAYIKNDPALYCTLCRTTVAQAELDDLEQNTTFNDITFTTTDGQHFTIATTRPELLGSCVGVMIHPDDARFKHLIGKQAIVPIFGHQVTILADEKVAQDKGTGIVMTCTFGDKTDIEWFKKYNLPYRPSIGLNGKFVAETGALADLTVPLARAKILDILKEQGLLTAQKQIQNSVNVHERCKNPIEYAILPQWFIKIVPYSQQFLDAADQINWYPKHMKARLVDWIKNLSWDWGISRQRVFGIPFPVWYCNDCSQTLFADISQLPVDPQETAYGKPCTNCSSSNIRPEKDVMDTWNTSSLTPYICKQLYKSSSTSPFADSDFIPMSMRPQAHDIIRTWAFYTIVKSWMHQQQIPWNDIVISGYVLSEQKEKISKSKDNAPTDPEKLLTQYAPDAIRFWTASGTLGQDTAFSPEQMNIGQKLLTKLWNAVKFVDMHCTGQNYVASKPENFDIVNGWIIEQLETCKAQYHEYFQKHEFSLALQTVEKMFWHDFCDNYLEIVKDQLFNPTNYSDEQVQATRWTLAHTSFTLLQLYSPFLPHITEYLYQQVFKATRTTDSIHLTQITPAQTTQHAYAQDMNLLLDIIAQVRKLKSEAQLSLKTELASVTVGNLTDEQVRVMREQENILKGVCKAQKIIATIEKQVAVFEQQADTWIAKINKSSL